MKANISEITEIAPNICKLKIVTDEEVTFTSGQYLLFAVRKDGRLRMKPYTIMSAPWENSLEFAIRRAGNISDMICDHKKGDEIEVIGPKGHFTLPDDDIKHYLLICNGIGISHMRSLIRTLFEKHYSGKGKNTDKPVTLLYGARNKDTAVFDDEMRELEEAQENFHYHLTLSREDGPLRGYVQDHLNTLIEAGQTAFACGTIAMAREVKTTLEAQGIRTLTEFAG